MHFKKLPCSSCSSFLIRKNIYFHIFDSSQAIVANPVDVICNCYGSHVLRSLLCLCRGAPLDSSEFHRAKPSAILAERLNLTASRSDKNALPQTYPVFSELSKFLISGILRCSRKDIRTLQTDQYSSLVLQACLTSLSYCVCFIT